MHEAGDITMMIPDSGLGESLEIQDLLYYLQDRIKHWPVAYYQDLNRELIHPRVTDAANWHCSIIGDWAMVKRNAES